jgi:hypothetical protein
MAINATYFLDAADLSLATAVYLDSNLSSRAPDGFYSDGTISREQSGGILLVEENCDCAGVLMLAYRSDGSVTNTGTLCETLTLDNDFYISGNDVCIISTGNIAYNTNDSLDTFDGEDKFYLIAVAICEITTDTYITQINSVGYITVIGVCEAPPL